RLFNVPRRHFLSAVFATPHTNRLPEISGPNRQRCHIPTAFMTFHFLTSFIGFPQHATHRTALWACVFHPHFLHFSFRYMLSPPPSDRFVSWLFSAMLS